MTAAPAPAPTQLPTGGTLAAGAATIAQNGSTLNINQTSNRAALNWQTFNVGSAATVNFNQPSTSSVTLNRINDSNPSQIFGQINANGQVYLTNPNGLYFAPSASANVGGLVATTNSISDADFMAGNNTFTRNGATGSVINDGNLTASLGGYIALLAPEVQNNGVIIAQMGTAALAAGENYTLQFDNNNALTNVIVTPATIAALVQNGNAVRAPGGLIILSAQAASSLQGGVVNNSGKLEANGLVNNGGVLRLSASDTINHTGSITADAAPNSSGNGGTVSVIADLANANSQTNINGSISAQGGSLGGNGGQIETSAAILKVGDTAHISTAASMGLAGSWLLDPEYDFTIASGNSGTVTAGTPTGDISGTTLSNALGSGNVTILSSQGSNTSGSGNINVNDAVTWSANTLTLTAANNININATMTANGSSILVMNTATANGSPSNAAVTGGQVLVGLNSSGFTGGVNFFQVDGVTPRSGTGFLTINGTGYNVITSLSSIDQSTAGMSLSYALSSNIATAGISTPIGNSGNTGNSSTSVSTYNGNVFYGNFNGLGHTIGNLAFNQPSNNFIGLFGFDMGLLSNIGLTDVNVTGYKWSGGLAGYARNNVSNCYVTGSVTGAYYAGGVAGSLNNYYTMENSFFSGTVIGNTSGAWDVGGLIGSINGGATVSSSFSTGTVTATSTQYVGGLIGLANGSVSNSFSNANVTGLKFVGGFVGQGGLAISNSFATGTVNASDICVGGFAGSLTGGSSATTVSNSYATGSVSGGKYSGGFVGLEQTKISNSYSTGQVTGLSNYTGGFAGWASSLGSHYGITNSFYNSSGGNASLPPIPALSTGATTGIVGMTSANMKLQANFTGSVAGVNNSNGVNPSWDFTTPVWGITSANSGYPILCNVTAACITAVYLDLKPTSGSTYSSVYGSTPSLVYVYDTTSPTWSSGDSMISNTTISAPAIGTLTYPTLTLTSTSSAGSTQSLTPNITGITVNSGYTIAAGNAVTWSIAQKPVTLSATKTYDRSTSLTGDVTINTGISGQSLTYTGATASSQNVSSNGSNYISAITLADGTGGLASNYILPTLNYANAPVTINAKPVTVTGTQVYNNTTTVPYDSLAISSGIISGDTVTINSSGSGTLVNANVGSENISSFGTLALYSSRSSIAHLTIKV